MPKGLDTAVDTTDYAADIAEQGFEFVVRYYRSQASSYPHLTRKEAQALTDAGLYIVTVYEGASDHRSYFTAQQGVHDAKIACLQAQAAGQPSTSPIYFAVDYDAPLSHLVHSIKPYFDAIADFLDASTDTPLYHVGVYGSGLTCQWLSENAAYLDYTWLAVSSGWAGHDYSSWNMKQTSVTHVLGLDVDIDISNGNAGGWQLSSS